jgi:2-polyprenyl-3-methyl-5-hydroxy-6-metoxy-1,4-benzoquinol methylase
MLRKLFFNLAYYQRPIWDSGISPPELMEFISSHLPGKALDLGCGTGTNLLTLAQHGWEANGVDFSRRAVKLARKKAQQNQVKIDVKLGDVTHLDGISGKFDLVLDMGCFHSLPSHKRPGYIVKIDQLLADDGTFLLYLFKTSNPGIYPGATDEDIQFVIEHLQVMDRRDSTERGIRPSIWFTLQKKR